MHYGYYLLAVWSFFTIIVALMQPAGLPLAVKGIIVLFIASTAIMTWILRNGPSHRSRFVLFVWGSGITALTTIDMLIDLLSMWLAGFSVMTFGYLTGHTPSYVAGSYVVVILSWYGAHVGTSMKRRWLGGTITMLCLLVGSFSFAIRDFLTYENN